MAARDLLSASPSSDDESNASTTASPVVDDTLTINKDYAKRFEHNHKRAELHRLQEKFGPDDKTARHRLGEANAETPEESSSEEEDDQGELISEALDSQIAATISAIRRGDPCVYDASTTFYDASGKSSESLRPKTEKPMQLGDYHRQHLVATSADHGQENETSLQEERALQVSRLVDEIKRAQASAPAEGASQAPEADDDGFLVKRRRLDVEPQPTAKTTNAISQADIQRADADPDHFLTKFLASRAWVQNAEAHAFQSDDSDAEQRAEDFETAYNLRFEDPQHANEKLVSHARDATIKYSVRKDAPTRRQKARERARVHTEALADEERQERKRLRKLRLDEAQHKLQQIREAAGLKETSGDDGTWAALLASDWDDQQWTQQMTEQFDNDYYKASDHAAGNDVEGHKKPVRKPKWKDDIGIDDLGLEAQPLDASESDLKLTNGMALEPSTNGKRTGKRKAAAPSRTERQRIKSVVDASLDIDHAARRYTKQGSFRYRDTSPTAFGLTTQDILTASDSQLNQYAGLKKLATYRDADKKRRDRKRLGKKARLREWRRETFGDEQPAPSAEVGKR